MRNKQLKFYHLSIFGPDEERRVFCYQASDWPFVTNVSLLLVETAELNNSRTDEFWAYHVEIVDLSFSRWNVLTFTDDLNIAEIIKIFKWRVKKENKWNFRLGWGGGGVSKGNFYLLSFLFIIFWGFKWPKH